MKKIMYIILAVMVMLSTVAVQGFVYTGDYEGDYSTCEGMIGDVDGSGDVNDWDLNLIRQMVAGQIPSDDCGDMDGDGIVSSGDVAWIGLTVIGGREVLVVDGWEEQPIVINNTINNTYTTSVTNNIGGGSSFHETTIWEIFAGGSNYVSLWQTYEHIIDYMYTVFATVEEVNATNLRLDRVEARQNLIISGEEFNMYDLQMDTKIITAKRTGVCQEWHNYKNNFDYICCADGCRKNGFNLEP